MTTEPLALDLFPECPAPLPVPRKRKAATPAAKAALPGGLVATAADTLVTGAAIAAVVQNTVHLAPTVVDSGLPTDVEAMARVLQDHPDYRVLRRLKPCLDWPHTGSAGPLTRVLVLDTETTGLDSSKDRIIELALLRVDVDPTTGLPVGPVEVYDELEDPGRPIPQEVVAITGIQDGDVQGKRLDDARIAAMLDGVDLVIAHNAAFDRPFVEQRIPAFAQLPWACSFADIDWKAQGQGSAKLESLAQAQGWFYDAHRAEMDCHALLAVLSVPWVSLATGDAEDSSMAAAATPPSGLGQLLKAAQSPSYLLQATGAPFDAKDLLKARGYRWNAEQRVWQTRIASEDALDAELAWLKAQVYGARHATLALHKLDALCKYSQRSGVVTQQSI